MALLTWQTRNGLAGGHYGVRSVISGRTQAANPFSNFVVIVQVWMCKLVFNAHGFELPALVF
eukprot:1633139-Amphidinium_carterae.1